MNDFESSLERYLDGLMEESEKEQFEAVLASDPDLAKEVEQQLEIDTAIRNQFKAPEVTLSFLDDFLTDGTAATEEKAPSTEPVIAETRSSGLERIDTAADEPHGKRGKYLLLAIAASLAWAVVAAQFYYRGGQGDQAIAFRPRPLTDLYQECLNDGFEPYWVCDNDEVFAATFQSRQGIPLVLANLPSDRSMVGLSYLAGISRNSTSVLARVGGVPVIVFVGRLESDWKPEVGFFQEQGLNVFRSQSDELVFYEVSPLDSKEITQYLKPRTIMKN